MEAVLVPVDFSPTSINAAAYALRYARQTGEKIILLHSYEAPLTYPVYQGAEITPQGLHDIYIKELKLLAAQLSESEPLVKVEHLLMEGNLADTIVRLTESMKFSIIIMGLTGKGKIGKKIIGSNTLKVSKKVSIPVLIIPEHAVFNSVNDIGLTTDFKDVANRIPEKSVKKIVEQTGAKLHVMYVDFNNLHFTKDTPLQSGLVETMFQQYHPYYHFIENPDMVEGLNECSDKFGIELLIVIPHKHNLLEKIFTGSHTKELLFESEVPVMVMHE